MASTEQEILEANVRRVMATQPGMDVIWHILSFCDIYIDSTTDYSAGKRRVGYDILEMFQDADPRLYPNLLLTKQKGPEEDE